MDSTAKSAAATPIPDTTAAPVAVLTDVNIVALLDEANAGDSAMGKLASTKGTSAAVKEFGRDMARDHHKLREAGQSVAKKENLAPQAPSNDTLATASAKMQDNMTSMAKGKDWDKAYIDNEVAVHQSVLNLLQTASTAAGHVAQGADHEGAADDPGASRRHIDPVEAGGAAMDSIRQKAERAKRQERERPKQKVTSSESEGCIGDRAQAEVTFSPFGGFRTPALRTLAPSEFGHSPVGLGTEPFGFHRSK
jgi:putative membrane protein